MNENFPTDKVTHLGDLVISVEQAVNQAKFNNTPINDEVSLLLIHGILHLFGYDHDTKKNKDRMWKVQENLLRQSGISIRSPKT
jgi:probable rRNA maturation factor